MTETLKILKFVAGFGWGGTERQFVNLGLGLDPSRYAVHFGCLRKFGVLLDEIEVRGCPVLQYDVFSLRNPLMLAAQLRLARDLRRFSIDVVHSYGFYSNVFAIPAAKLAGASVVASIRDMGIYLSARQRTVQRVICKLADRILVNANAIKEWLVSEGYDGDRITVIPNGVALNRFADPSPSGTLHRELGLEPDAPLVGVVGRISRFKGVEDFLAAAAIIAPRFPAVRFVIIGESSFITRDRTTTMDYSYHNGLRQLAANLGLADRVIFTGFRPDVERILPELAISVLPSLSEGLSNTLLESMAAGAPVVATRVGGTAEVVHDAENGLLVPPGDADSLAAAITRLLSDRDLAAQLGAAARAHIVETYSMRKLIDRTSQIYETLGRRSRRVAADTSLNPI